MVLEGKGDETASPVRNFLVTETIYYMSTLKDLDCQLLEREGQSTNSKEISYLTRSIFDEVHFARKVHSRVTFST